MPITYLAVVSLVMEFCLLIYYGNTIRTAKTPDSSSVFPAHLTAEIESVIAQLKDASGLISRVGGESETIGRVGGSARR